MHQDSEMDRRRGHAIGRNCYGGKRNICVTVVFLGIVIVCALLAYTAFATSLSTQTTTIQQLIFVFRHGDRTPTETYPKDPYLNYPWPGGWGTLTKKGMLQMYNVGQWIRREYGSIIGKKYESSKTLIRSSYADRCVMSAQALLAGLFLPGPDDIFLPGLMWQPTPVHSIPRSLDKVITVKAPCPRLENALQEAYANDSRKNGERMASYYSELSSHTGKNMTTITDVEFLYNTLEIEEQHGLKLPEWTRKFYNKEMRDIAARSLGIFTSNTLQQRLRGGPLLKEIVQHMKETESEKEWKTTYMYSAHDITLVNLLRTMGFTNELFKPDYGATLIFEVRAVEGIANKEIKVLYLNSSSSETTHPMKIPKCGDPCYLRDLTNIWKDVIPENWDDECLI